MTAKVMRVNALSGHICDELTNGMAAIGTGAIDLLHIS